MSGWGGERKGSGRPKGSVKAEGVRPQHQIRAYDDEWQLIQKFARLVKANKELCADLMKQFD